MRIPLSRRSMCVSVCDTVVALFRDRPGSRIMNVERLLISFEPFSEGKNCRGVVPRGYMIGVGVEGILQVLQYPTIASIRRSSCSSIEVNAP